MSKQLESEPKPQVKSLLSGAQRLWLTIALALTALLLANTVYLLSNRIPAILPVGSAERITTDTLTISKWFQVMVLSHTGLGFLVVFMLLMFAVWHLPTVWRRHRRQTVVSGVLFLTSGLALAIKPQAK